MRALLLLFVVAVAGACTDSRCNPKNCAALINECHVAFSAQPNGASCNAVDGGVPNELDLVPYCPSACQAQDQGQFVQCVADSAAACTTTSGRASVLSGCLFGRANVEAGCAAGCQSSRTDCEAACSKDAYQPCMDCAASCGLAWAKCVNACPK